MSASPLARYNARVEAGEASHDDAQAAIAARLDALANDLKDWRPANGGWKLSNLFAAKRPPPRGLYIHGKVGRGKTMLMDLFFDTVTFAPKRRVHFHEFMAETHDRIGDARRSFAGDPLPHVANAIADNAQLLCFDELHVTDIADAMILGRLFKGLFERQVVMVATSNLPPRRLYLNGLNRALFLPSIDLIEQHMDVVELGAAKDFRLDKLAGQPLYFTPANSDPRRALRAAFTRLTGVWKGKSMTLDVKGRPLIIPEAARGVAYFTFDDLCAKPLGPLDYLHIANAFHTVIIEGIPKLPPEKRNEARRFINLVDTLYDGRIGLIVSAAAEPDELYPAGDAAILFERTASRLIEMRSEAYLASRADRIAVGEAEVARPTG
ncbi:MAG: cell division protein ZapE [Hyphomicrobiaceae bacterium]